MKKNTIVILLIIGCLMACQSNIDKASAKDENMMDSTIVSGETHFKFDDFELWTLQDKVNTMSMELFADADPAVVKELVPSGEADAAINTFLVYRNGQYILFDTGIGVDNGGVMLEKLHEIGVNETDIKAVCLTHFHFDHIGGLLTNGQVSFPNAELYFSEKELAANKNDKGVQALLKAYQNHTHAFADNAVILDGVITIPAAGHTPGHCMYKMGNLLIIGDVIHAAALQIPHPEFCARYDQDKEQAIQIRQNTYQYIQDQHLIVAGMHLPHNGVMSEFSE
ncbi:MAG: MBL fold metallo-hydrolase [Bacteroidales bacterium]|nr:MBL fold metallo-hydrolase [Bacteroidales bacterium]